MVFAQRSAIALTYGTHLYSNSFVGQVNTLDSFQIGRPVQYIGLSANGYILFSRKVSLDGHLIMAKYLPQQINLNDSTDEKVNLSVKNMFISPKASAMLILYLKSISLSFNAEYGYDISASGWKRKIFGRQESSLDLPSYNQSGLGFSVALGCAF